MDDDREAAAEPSADAHDTGEDAGVPGGDGGASMPPWIPRAVVVFLLGVTALAISYWIFLRLRGLLSLLLISLFLSFALEPAVNWLERHGIRRGVGTGMVFVGVAVVAAGFVLAVGSLVVDQANTLVDRAPGYIEDAELWAERNFDVEIDADELVQEFQEGGAAADLATGLADDLVEVGRQLLTAVFQFLAVLLFTFYLIADGPRLRRAVCSVLPERRQREVLRAWNLAIDKTGGYIYSRALLAVIAFLSHWIAFAVIGMPFPLPLALWVGVFSQFIPTVGTYIAGVLPVLIAVLDDDASPIWVLIFIVVYQQLENYLLQPRITAQHLDMHPAVAFGMVLAGAALLGATGALLALPAGATLQAFISTYLNRHEVVESRLTHARPTRTTLLSRLRSRRRPATG
ncbi:MAG: AI-2E family transporter [Actinomycetota bacterium]